jgi:hypothetical protein
MSTKFLFVDPTNCNAGCDTPLLNNLNEKKLKQFSICFLIKKTYSVSYLNSPDTCSTPTKNHARDNINLRRGDG